MLQNATEQKTVKINSIESVGFQIWMNRIQRQGSQ